MFEKKLNLMRTLVRAGNYALTIHAFDEMNSDGLSIDDIENCILSGKIVGRQRDEVSTEWKYLIAGNALTGGDVVIVAKIVRHDQPFVIITVYRENFEYEN